jgi:hypothetical protein
MMLNTTEGQPYGIFEWKTRMLPPTPDGKPNAEVIYSM